MKTKIISEIDTRESYCSIDCGGLEGIDYGDYKDGRVHYFCNLFPKGEFQSCELGTDFEKLKRCKACIEAQLEYLNLVEYKRKAIDLTIKDSRERGAYEVTEHQTSLIDLS